MRRAFFILLGLAVLSLSGYVAIWAQPSLTQTDLEKLLAQETEFIKTTLAKPKLDDDKKSQRRLRLTALMIAQYAQSAIGNGNPKNLSLATLRDNALALRQAVEDKKFGEASKLVDRLSLSGPANAGAKLDPGVLVKLEDFEDIMSQFSSSRLGGFGLEDFLDELTELKANPNDDETRKIQLYARKVTMIGTLIEPHTPAKLGGARTVEAWKELSKQLQADATALGRSVEKKRADGVAKAALKLADTCKSCHDVFK
jgi:hypothetical protein